MAVNTWDGASDTNWNDAANWNTTGVTDRVPTADDDVVIANVSNNCVMPDGLNPTINSLLVESSASLTAGNNNITIDSHPASGTNRPIDLSGTFVKGTSTLTFTYSAAETKYLNFRGVEVHNVVINGANTTFAIGNGALTATGDVTVTAGTLDTYSAQNNALTVAGNTLVDGTLTGNNSTLTFGTDGVHGSTEGGCLLVNSSGTFTFGSGDVTIFSGFTAKGTEGSPNVTSTGGGDILIKGRTNNGFMNSHSHQGTNITGDYIIDYDNNAIFDNRSGTTIACGKFIIKHGGRTYEPWNNSAQATFKIIGDMDIQNGTFDTEYSGQSSQHLTVTGNVDITGTLTCNASAVSFGSLKCQGSSTLTATSGTTTITSENSSGQAIIMNNSMTFNNSDGTFLITTPAATNIYFKSDNALHHLTINHSSADIVLAGNPDDLKCEGDLTITAGTLQSTTSGATLEVDGDASVTGTLNWSGTSGGAVELGSLEIASGGTYNATSGTTTITTGAATYSSEGSFAIVGGGTFTHNNGTLVLDSVGQRLPKGGTFYNVTLTGSQSTGGLYLYNSVLSPAGIMPDGTTGANYVSILGTLSITDDEFRPYNADKVYVHNLIIGDGTGSANEAKFDMSEADTFDGTVFVDNVTINSDGQLLFGDGDETSSTVGSSALNIYGAFRNIGGSVDIT